MVVVCPAPPGLNPRVVKLYYTKDALLADLPVVVFYGPSTTTNSTLNSSRIQAHVYTLAGFQSFPRLTISPSSPLYAAVNHLPTEKQGDETCRGLAVSLLKYFAEMPKTVKSSLKELAAIRRPDGMAPAMFDEMHAGDIAGNMVEIENVDEVAGHITSALGERIISWLDVDVVLPRGSTKRIQSPDSDIVGEDGASAVDYGKYEQLIGLFGSPSFLPTSKLRRAPSKPTTVSRTRTLAKDQKESLRREMCELLDTEERYVSKLDELVNNFAVQFRQAARNEPIFRTSPSERVAERLLPDSLDRILGVNTSFSKDIRVILEKSENEAIKDIQGSTESGITLDNSRPSGRPTDPTGTEAFAKSLLSWFPYFTEPYQDYLRASSEFPKIVSSVLRDSASSSARQIQDTGEQRLRSMLIEPVQRLPRYSLFIDNMVNLLPATHPALSKFLKAKDIITDICALDNDPAVDINLTATRLRDLISGWPASFTPRGRLITAMDVAELKPPHSVALAAKEGQASIILLFPDSVVVVRKVNGNSVSARGILAEVDRPASVFNPSLSVDGSGAASPKALTFGFSFALHETRFTESDQGRLIWMACINCSTVEAEGQPSTQKIHAITKVYALLGSYDGKAARWNEEVARARIEGRFGEDVRESDKWSLRSINTSPDGLGILAAIFEDDGSEGDNDGKDFGRVRVVIDRSKAQRWYSPGHWGIEITACITPLESSRYRLEFEDSGDSGSTDNVTNHDFAAVFVKRLGNLLRVHNQPQDNKTAQAHISFHQRIIESLPIRRGSDESEPRNFRPVSPVKLISNFLGGNSGREPGNSSKQRTGHPSTKDVPVMLPSNRLPSRPRSYQKTTEESAHSKVTLVGADGADPKNTLSHLEETFSAYVIALRSRSGNVVGKVLRGRVNADELLVNELYNTLVEEPSRIQSAAEVSIDVLFSAFEKFLNKAWKQRMGPVLTAPMLKDMLSKLDAARPCQAAEQFKILLSEMTPQNRRAFTAMIKLLSELLDASGNDGDRGALIATFAEALVTEGNPHEYITLLDRLVEDYDTLFDGRTPRPHDFQAIHNVTEAAAPSRAGDGTSMHLVSEPLKRSRSINTGSLSSNASSLRKRFGFSTLSRENSKTDSESRVGSVWRTLSKNSKSSGDGDSQPPSLSKSSLLRSKSTDTDGRKLAPVRPVSRDRPNISGAFPLEESQARPRSAHNTISSLTTIGEGVPDSPVISPRKKRRSSLSDLRAIHSSNDPSLWSSIQPRTMAIPKETVPKVKLSPRTPSPKKQYVISSSNDNSPRFRGSPSRKENSPPILTRNTLTERAVNRKSDEVVITSFSPQKRKTTQTGIPTLTPGLSERPSPSQYSTNPPKKLVQTPQKLRIQSPQKLRERLQQEQKAISEADTSLQAELSKIGEEMSALNLQRYAPKPHKHDSDALASRITALESRTTALLTDLTTRTTSIQKDLESSLLVSERKAKSLDQLYREANAENEALYERFNEELGKVLKGVKGGQGVEEMRVKMKEAQMEAARLKKENQRLKRENLGLRCQLKGD